MCNCNNNNFPCNCQQIPMPCSPCQPTDCTGCPVKDLSTDCVVFTGDPLECSDIPSNTPLTDVIKQLDAYICTAISQLDSSINLINTGDGAAIYNGIDGIGRRKIKSLISSDDSVIITENADTIDITSSGGGSESDTLQTVTTRGDTTTTSITANSFIKSGGTSSQYLMADGSVTAVAPAPYKVYTALINQIGTNAPVATVLENTLGSTVVWTRFGVGTYIGTVSNSAFTVDKTTFLTTQTTDGGATYPVIVNGGRQSASEIFIKTLQTDNLATTIDGYLSQATVEVRVYN